MPSRVEYLGVALVRSFSDASARRDVLAVILGFQTRLGMRVEFGPNLFISRPEISLQMNEPTATREARSNSPVYHGMYVPRVCTAHGHGLDRPCSVSLVAKKGLLHRPPLYGRPQCLGARPCHHPRCHQLGCSSQAPFESCNAAPAAVHCLHGRVCSNMVAIGGGGV